MNMTRRILALLLVMLLALPTIGMAESFSAKLTLTDPIALVNGEEMNLEGLGIQMGFSGADANEALISLMLLANQQPVVGVNAGIQGDTAFAIMTGISSAFVMPASELSDLVEGQISGMGEVTDMAEKGPEMLNKFFDFANSLDIEETGKEKVDFGAGEVEATVYDVNVTNEQLKTFFKDIASEEFPDNYVATATVWNQDGTLNNKIDIAMQEDVNGEKSLLGMVQMAMYAPDENSLVVDMAVIGEGDKKADECKLNLTMGADQKSPHFEFTATTDSGNGEGDDIGTINVTYKGIIEGDTKHIGTFSVAIFETEGKEALSFATNVELDLGEETRMPFPDLSGMEQINPKEMTAEQSAMIEQEAQTEAMVALGKLMSIPALAELISSMMG